MEKLLKRYDDRPEVQNKILNYYARWKYAKHIFLSEFNNERETKFRVGRSHMGSFLAFGLATYNTYNLRQQIIKQAVTLTRSKNPKIIKFAMVNLTVLYWLGLSFIWHIPSITIEFGFHYYNGLYAGLLAFLLPPDQMVKITMNQKIIEGTELGLVLKQRQKGLKP